MGLVVIDERKKELRFQTGGPKRQPRVEYAKTPERQEPKRSQALIRRLFCSSSEPPPPLLPSGHCCYISHQLNFAALFPDRHPFDLSSYSHYHQPYNPPYCNLLTQLNHWTTSASIIFGRLSFDFSRSSHPGFRLRLNSSSINSRRSCG